MTVRYGTRVISASTRCGNVSLDLKVVLDNARNYFILFPLRLRPSGCLRYGTVPELVGTQQEREGNSDLTAVRYSTGQLQKGETEISSRVLSYSI